MLEEIIKEIKSEDSLVRREAMRKLAKIGDESAIPYLVDALQDEALSVQEAAAEAIKSIGGKQACEMLISYLKSNDPAIRNLAKTLLESIGSTAIETVLPLAKDSEPDIRLFAANIFGKIKHPESITTLISLLEDESFNVKDAAINALGEVEAKGAIPYLERILEEYKEDAWLSFSTITAIEKIGGEAAVEALIKHLDIQLDDMIIHSFIESLCRLKDARAIIPLLESLERMRDCCRFVVISNLVKELGGELIVQKELLEKVGFCDMLIKFVLDEERHLWSRYYMIEFLGKIGQTRFWQDLLQFLSRDNPILKIIAVKTLGEIGAKESVKELERFLDTEDPILKETIQMTIKRLQV
jgi:HEAT repeat protein